MTINLDQIAKQRGVKISYFESTTSTNTLALEGGYRHAELLLANHQSAGRGQKGHSWESVRGENLTFSLVIEPRWLPASQQFKLSKMVSLALIDTLATYGIDGRIKWTNDIYIEERKVAGILIENEVVGDRVERSVLGVGLNINQRSFSSDLPNPTSMTLEIERLYGSLPSEGMCGALPSKRGRAMGRTLEVGIGQGESGEVMEGTLEMSVGREDSGEVMANQGVDMGVRSTEMDCIDILDSNTEFDRMEVLERFLTAFWNRYRSLSEGMAESLDGDYHERLYLLNTPHRYTLPSGDSFIGIIRSVASSGELVIEHEDGSMKGYLFGEVVF